MRDKLTIFDKIRIQALVSADVRKRRIKEAVEEIPDPQNPGRTIQVRLIMAPFFKHEAAQYRRSRDVMLFQKKHWYWTKNKRFKKVPRRAAFPQQIAAIEGQLIDFQGKVNLLTMEYGEKINNQNRRQRRYAHDGEMQMVQLCINRTEDIRAEFGTKANDLYLSIGELLNQKASRIEEMQKRILVLRSKHLHRMYEYYYQACQRNNALDADAVTEEMLAQVVDISMMEEYDKLLEETKDKLAAYEQNVAAMTPGAQMADDQI